MSRDADDKVKRSSKASSTHSHKVSHPTPPKLSHNPLTSLRPPSSSQQPVAQQSSSSTGLSGATAGDYQDSTDSQSKESKGSMSVVGRPRDGSKSSNHSADRIGSSHSRAPSHATSQMVPRKRKGGGLLSIFACCGVPRHAIQPDASSDRPTQPVEKLPLRSTTVPATAVTRRATTPSDAPQPSADKARPHETPSKRISQRQRASSTRQTAPEPSTQVRQMEGVARKSHEKSPLEDNEKKSESQSAFVGESKPAVPDAPATPGGSATIADGGSADATDTIITSTKDTDATSSSPPHLPEITPATTLESDGPDDDDNDDDESEYAYEQVASPPVAVPPAPSPPTQHDDVVSQGQCRDDEQPQCLLPPQRLELKGRKCLVLDLDETLVHSSFKILHQADFTIPVEIEGNYHNVYVIKRPGVDEFMRRVGELYEVVVFTASVAKYGDPLLDQLDIHKVVHHRLFRESCYNHQGNYVKDLSQIGRQLGETIIIDNSPTSYIFHPQHAVPISSWFSDAHDNELLDLIPVLEELAGANVPDVSLVLDVTL